MEWTSDHIAVWFFPRYAIPEDISADAPTPANWGPPAARFVSQGGTGCNLDDYFVNNNIVFTNTFCGDWSGAPDVWNNNPVCSALAPTCVDYVNNNPAAYENAYWSVNSVKVFQQQQGVSKREKLAKPFTA